MKKRNKEGYESNRKARVTYQQRWYAKHRKRALEQKREYYRRDRRRILKAAAVYRADNWEAIRADQRARRRARKALTQAQESGAEVPAGE
jgi:hypothetical protein